MSTPPQPSGTPTPDTPDKTVGPSEAAAPALTPGRESLHYAVRNPKLLIGLAIVLILLGTGVLGPLFLDSSDPNAYVGPQAAAPDGTYWLGTTTFGQDIYAQFVYGLRSTFLVGVIGGGIAAIVAMLVGFLAGYRGGIVDEILTMLTNIVLVIPSLAVLLIANAYLGVRSVGVQGLFIGLTSWPWAARAIRAQTFSLRSREFVDLARLSGSRTWRIIFREIAPNMSSYLFMTFILLFGGSILIASSLDFIGLGPTEGVSLGLMLQSAQQWSALQLGMWWWFVPPGIGITAVVGALYVANVGLDEVFNPKLRES
ncbi:ABC transporter permease [Streptomyces nodosus]|uniref:ABC transporter permease n=1 Tax=Streptomyces nodosus TaxID=40318 RepID=A0A0B5DSX6_9ACTN|nr:ABC transporter permease [Streptomyces nodosus]AJE43721.1 peptide ABC transporter permease [Streptomyces nodosus]MBB4795235.1 peptide/nickel transport system permease protein [Streptomyces nodosus]QEV42228.1 ABC transporter permease [Streptomyces nodosus]